jgi:signal recognition particle receptor subunit beta
MVQINFASREVSCKIVYYGPGRCGKTTNLQVVHAKAPPTSTGEMISIATKGDRTLYFDFLSLDLGTVAGMRTRFHLYTVPGQVYYDQTRKLVLQGSDGIVFVADSARGMMAENIESLDNLVKNLHENGLDIKDIPVVLQWNKRDLPDAMPVDELDKTLNRHHWPTFEATAVKGHGVFQTLKGIAQQVIRKLNREQGFSDDGHSRKADAKLISVPPPPPPPPRSAAAARPVVGTSTPPTASAPPPISAPQAPRSQVAPPSVPKAAPTGGPGAMPAALRPPTIQPRSAPAAKPAAPPRVAPPPPSAQQPVPAPVPPAHPPSKPVAPPSKPAAPPPTKPAAPPPAKPAAPPPAKPAAPPPPPVVPPAPTTTPVPEPGPRPGSEPALRSAFKTFKVSHYPPLPEDMEEGDAAAAPSATPAPPVAVPTAPPVSTGPKSSGSVKSVLLLVGLLALAGAAIAAYQYLIRK